jgi:beta-glucosidase-like glycosyl hydrolase
LEYLRGLNDAGVLGCLKHFPGHGNTNVDSHLGLPVLKETLEQLLENGVSFYKGNRKRRRLNYDRTFSRPCFE